MKPLRKWHCRDSVCPGLAFGLSLSLPVVRRRRVTVQQPYSFEGALPDSDSKLHLERLLQMLRGITPACFTFLIIGLVFIDLNIDAPILSSDKPSGNS
jgi:hypothetical protein